MQEIPHDTWKDRLTRWGVVTLLAPLWIPYAIYDTLDTQCRIFWHLRGGIEAAWNRCAETWSSSPSVYGIEVGAAMRTPLEHFLAVKFARYHRNAETFLTEKLRDPNPQLAAYAFKCLIRCRHLTLADIPADVLERREEINWLPFGCMGDKISLNEFIRNYFLYRNSYY